MDNGTLLENININERKELFEYEMTEVTLKLKGEFATISGCGKRYRDTAVDDESLVVSVRKLPAVELEDVKTDYPDVSALKIPAFSPSEVARYQAQLEIASSCPDIGLERFSFSLSPATSSASKDVNNSKIASIDDKKLYAAASAAKESASSIERIRAEILPIESAIPAIPNIGITGQLVLSEGVIKKNNIDIPQAAGISEICLDFSLAERITQPSDRIPIPTIPVPNIGESVSPTLKINEPSINPSSSIRNAIEEIESSDFGVTSINASSFVKKIQKGGASHNRMKTIEVPHIPIIKK